MLIFENKQSQKHFKLFKLMEPSIEDLTDPKGFSKSNEFTPLNPEKSNDGGFKVIAGCFAVLTGVISVALAIHKYQGGDQVGVHGSLVSDNKECSNIGESIYQDGGNAVDVAVGVTFCMGVVHPHLTGIGGNGLLLIYDHKLGRIVDCSNFNGQKSTSDIIGVPGFIKGLYAAHTKFGNLSWKQVLTYSVQLARSGFIVTETLKNSMNYLKPENLNSDLGLWLSSISLGETVLVQPLSNSLEDLANQGGDDYYDGIFTKNLAHILSSEDMMNYQIKSGACVEENWKQYKLFTTGQGTGGPLLINVLNNTNIDLSDTMSTIDAINGVVKTQEKYMNGVVVSAVDNNDLYVSIFSGLGSILGSQELTPEGFILNDAVGYGKRKMFSKELTSLSLPLVITDVQVCSSRLITGASDFRDVLQLIGSLDMDLQTMVENPRFRISSHDVQTEDDHAPSFSPEMIENLKASGFNVGPALKPYPSINVIQKLKDFVNPYADSRGLGLAITL